MFSCDSEQPDMERTGLSSGKAESYLTSDCSFIGGTIACKLEYQSSPFKLDHEKVDALPSFNAHISTNTESDQFDTLESSSSAISLTSKASSSSDYALALNLLEDQQNVLDFFSKTSEDLVKSSKKAGFLVGIPSKEYAPSTTRLSLNIDSCITALLLESWLGASPSSDVASTPFSEEDYRYTPILSTDYPSNSEVATIEGMSISNAEKWETAFTDLINTSKPSDCTESSGKESLEDQLTELMYDYLIGYLGVTKEELASASSSSSESSSETSSSE
jgi:hypothetical protein